MGKRKRKNLEEIWEVMCGKNSIQCVKSCLVCLCCEEWEDQEDWMDGCQQVQSAILHHAVTHKP